MAEEDLSLGLASVASLAGLTTCFFIMHAIARYASKQNLEQTALLVIICEYVLVITIICYTDRLVTQHGGWIEILMVLWNISLYCARKMLTWMLYCVATSIELLQNWTERCQETIYRSIYLSSSTSLWDPMLVNVSLMLFSMTLHRATKTLGEQHTMWMPVMYMVASIKYLSLLTCVCLVDRLVILYGDWLYLLKLGITMILNYGYGFIKDAITALNLVDIILQPFLQQFSTVELFTTTTLLIGMTTLVWMRKDVSAPTTQSCISIIVQAGPPAGQVHNAGLSTCQEHEPPQEFLCPITGSIMSYPVSTENGSTYEYYAIQEWFVKHSTDPLTNVVVSKTILVPHQNLLNSIEDWVKNNPDVAKTHGYIPRYAVPPPMPSSQPRGPLTFSLF